MSALVLWRNSGDTSIVPVNQVKDKRMLSDPKLIGKAKWVDKAGKSTFHDASVLATNDKKKVLREMENDYWGNSRDEAPKGRGCREKKRKRPNAQESDDDDEEEAMMLPPRKKILYEARQKENLEVIASLPRNDPAIDLLKQRVEWLERKMEKLEEMVAKLKEPKRQPLVGDQAKAGTSTGKEIEKPVIVTKNEEEKTVDKMHLVCGVTIPKEKMYLLSSSSYKKMTRDLMEVLFSREEMAMSSVSGRRSNIIPNAVAKPALPSDKVDAIIAYVKDRFKGVETSSIKMAMAYKLKDITKQLKPKKD